jgi:hypothetical protein
LTKTESGIVATCPKEEFDGIWCRICHRILYFRNRYIGFYESLSGIHIKKYKNRKSKKDKKSEKVEGGYFFHEKKNGFL